MSNDQNPNQIRRKFLKLLSGGAVLIPLTALHGCSGEKDAPTATSAPAPKTDKPAAQQSQTAPMEKTSAPASDKPMPRLAEDDPQARSLGYLHDATKVDTGKYSRFEAGQACKNCALYAETDDAQWGGCSIFPGKLVNADGWCNVYAPKG